MGHFSNSEEIFDAIEYVAEEPSTKQKEMLLAEFLSDDYFRMVITAAMDPLVTYGVLKTPQVPSGHEHFDVGTWRTLGDLSKRTLTGHAAHEVLTDELEALEASSQELFKRILNKDLRAGIGVAIVNKAAKRVFGRGIIPDFPYQRCSLPKHVKLNEWPWKEGVDSQVKMDGMFANLSIPADTGLPTQLHTRKGQEFDITGSAWQTLKRELVLLQGSTRYSGELGIIRGGVLMRRKASNGIFNSLLKGRDELPEGCSVTYTIWDAIPLSAAADGVYEVPQAKRMQDLRNILLFLNLSVISLVESRIVFSYEEAQEHAEEVILWGGEGTIFKHPHGIWKKGTSRFEVKIKAEHEADLRMIELTPGTGKNEELFGSVRCGTDDGLVYVDVSGFSDKMREDIHKNWYEVYEGKLMEVTFNELINAKNRETFSLFLPRFSDFRFDKDDTDTLQSIRAMA